MKPRLIMACLTTTDVNARAAAEFETVFVPGPDDMTGPEVVAAATDLKADAILVFTLRGAMARHTAWMRPRHSPIFAFCEHWELADSLTLNYGVTASIVRFDHANPERTVERALALLVEQGKLKTGQTVVVISAITAGDQIVDAVQMRHIR